MNPILIHKGDDTIFADVTKFLTFNISTALDLKGFKAQFTLAYIEKTIDDISSKSFDVVLTASDTAKLWLGEQKGKLILFDSVGNRKTISTTIPFIVTTDVIENQPEVISLDVPQTSGVEIELEVKGGDFVTSVNGMTGDVVLTAEDVGALPSDTEIPSISGLATEQQLNDGLATKQDKGNYALKSEIPNISNLANKDEIPTLVSELENDSDYATQTQVMQAIAAIPQFSISLVESLPETGEKMVLYLVSKGGESPDVYDEYIWIEQTARFEFLGTTAVDLTDYVKNTDYATSSVGGVIKIANNYYYGLALNSSYQLYIVKAPDAQVIEKENTYRPIVPANLDLAVKTGVTTNTIGLTDEEKAAAQDWLGVKTAVVELTADSVELATNTIHNASELALLTITLPTFDSTFISQLNFTSGATATAFIAPDTIKWAGDDIVSGAFVPAANTRYTILFYSDGSNLRAVSQGVA